MVLAIRKKKCFKYRLFDKGDMELIYRELEPDLRAIQPSVCANKTCPSGNSATCAWFLLSFFFVFFVFHPL